MPKLVALLLLATFAVACAKAPDPTPNSVPIPLPLQQPKPSAVTGVDRAKALITEARHLQQEENRVAAQNRLMDAARLAAGNADLLAEIAGVILNQDFHGARQTARQALEIQPDHPQAHLVLGTALQLLDEPEAARSHLALAYEGTGGSLEAGLQFALVLESLNEPTAARSLLVDLKALFPQSAAVQQALQRLDTLEAVWPTPGTPGTPAADWIVDRWRFSSDLLVGWRQGEQTLVALGRDGKVRWEFSCGGEKILDFVWDQTGRRAIAFTATQGCLIDPANGRLLANTPPAGNATWGFVWRGDLLAFSAAIRPDNLPEGVAAYFGTDWRVYQLSEADGQVTLQHRYTALDGSRAAALSKDGRILFSWMGNHGAGRPRLFVEGRKVSEFEGLSTGAEFALDPRDDRFYFVSYGGALQARTLDGDLLWEQTGAMHVPFNLWADDQGQVLIVVKQGQKGFGVYDDQGLLLWHGPGWPAPGNERYVLARQPHETSLLDRKGQEVGRYPYGTFFTSDGGALVRKAGNRFLLYRLP